MQEFDKYKYYTLAVQSAKSDVQFFQKVYKELKGAEANIFAEDFCGTFALCCEWVKTGLFREAIGVDLDTEPIQYGFETHWKKLTEDQQKRLKILNKNVLTTDLPKADLIVAANFSYYLFKERKKLLEYFINANSRLRRNGLFIIDCFGGPETMTINEEETDHKNFSYFWDQVSFNPINHEAKFYIHFKRPGEKKRERVFSYDWRMWSIPELRDILKEAGFKKSHVYWEGTTSKGEGDGKFLATEKGDDSVAWIAYIINEK